MKGCLAALAAAIGLMTLVSCAEEPTASSDQGQMSPSSSPTIVASPTESPSREEEEDEAEEEGAQDRSPKVRRLDENAVLAMLEKYLNLYNGGDYESASFHLSSNVRSRCLNGVVDALAQTHKIEQIDYDVSSVRVWDDEPNMADVVTIESYGGEHYTLELGLAFAFEDGGWKLDDLYPLGAGAFC